MPRSRGVSSASKQKHPAERGPGALNISFRPTDPLPLLNEAMNLRLATLSAADNALLGASGAAVPGLDAASGSGPAQVSGAGLGGGPDQLSAQGGQPNVAALSAAATAAGGLSGKGGLALPPEDWFESSTPKVEAPSSARIEPAAPAQPPQPIQAVQAAAASAKVSAWLEAGLNSGSAAPARQFNGHEVNSRDLRVQTWATDTVSAAVTGTAAETLAGAVATKAALDWRRPDWQGVNGGDELARQIPLLVGQVPIAPQPAPMHLRLGAVLVDGGLTLGAVVAATLAVTLNLKEMPGIKEMAVGAAAVLVALGILYQLLFLTLGEATPGMKCAHVSLRTFDDERTTRGQRFGRLGALLLALLPAGLGVLWAVFDRDHLSLHDRLSGTYLRKS